MPNLEIPGVTLGNEICARHFRETLVPAAYEGSIRAILAVVPAINSSNSTQVTTQHR
jgi:hypothetical protein